MIQEGHVGKIAGPFPRGAAEQLVDLGLVKRRMCPQGDQKVEFGDPRLERVDHESKELGQGHGSSQVGNQNQDPFCIVGK